MKKLILALVIINLLTACASSKSKHDDEQANLDSSSNSDVVQNDNEANGENAAAIEAQNLADAEAAKAAEEAAAQAALAPQSSVYFPFDVDTIQESDKTIVQAHGAYLSEHAERKARAEGNADERGSSEYNLALGQRRAENTKKALVLSGANTDQVETISYGEERPKETGHDEASWAQNRRVDIVYP